MSAMGESEMVERRAPARRSSAQAQLDTRAIELAAATDARQEAHEQVCSERYRNIEANSMRTEAAIQTLNNDAKSAIDKVRQQQDDNHRENSAKLDGLINKQAGANGVWATATKAAQIILMVATLCLTIVWHR